MIHSLADLFLAGFQALWRGGLQELEHMRGRDGSEKRAQMYCSHIWHVLPGDDTARLQYNTRL